MSSLIISAYNLLAKTYSLISLFIFLSRLKRSFSISSEIELEESKDLNIASQFSIASKLDLDSISLPPNPTDRIRENHQVVFFHLLLYFVRRFVHNTPIRELKSATLFQTLRLVLFLCEVPLLFL